MLGVLRLLSGFGWIWASVDFRCGHVARDRVPKASSSAIFGQSHVEADTGHKASAVHGIGK